MNVRVTQQTILERALSSTRRFTDKLAALQSQAATGKRFERVSEDPIAGLAILETTSYESMLATHLDNIQRSRTALNGGASVLQQVSGLFTQARSLAIEATNSGNDANAFEAIAHHIDSALERLLELANTRQNNVYLFSGTAHATQPFVVTATDALGRPSEVQYQGADDPTAAIVERGQQVAIYHPGGDVFTANGRDAFQALIDLRDELRNVHGRNEHDQLEAISSVIGDLDSARERVLEKLGEESASLHALESLETHLKDMQTEAKKTISELGDADVTDIVVKLQMYERMLQLSLATFARISGVSLMDFLT